MQGSVRAAEIGDDAEVPDEDAAEDSDDESADGSDSGGDSDSDSEQRYRCYCRGCTQFWILICCIISRQCHTSSFRR